MTPAFHPSRRDRTTGAADPINDREFALVARIALEEAGLSIAAGKRQLVQSRLNGAVRRAQAPSIADYLDTVSDPANRDARRDLISALTTNVSSFFRERHHFDHLASRCLPEAGVRRQKSERIRIWSAGCSSGQEPYSIAMECLRSRQDPGDILVLATDIDPVILEKAREGIYTGVECDNVPPPDRRRFFEPAREPAGLQVRAEVRKLVRFRELNLHADWPMRHRFDAIFCRNVMIYFDEAHQRALVARFFEALEPGGYLYLGHSERIEAAGRQDFLPAGVTIYRKSTTTMQPRPAQGGECTDVSAR